MKKFLAIILAFAMVMAISAFAFADDAKPGESCLTKNMFNESM